MDGFAEKAFFEYHLYTLGRTTTLPNNSTKQIELFPTAPAWIAKRPWSTTARQGSYPRSYGSPMTDRNFGVQSNKKVDVYLRFKNAPGQQARRAAARPARCASSKSTTPTTASSSSART